MRRLFARAFAAWLLASPALAVLPDEQLADPMLEARARALSRSLRCVVCQNQSIDDSDAPLAHDLRVLLRERLSAGASDAQAVDFLVQRYGTYVLLKPPLTGETLVLWLGPLAVLVLGGAGVGLYLHRRRDPASTPAPLSAAEEAEVGRLIEAEDHP